MLRGDISNRPAPRLLFHWEGLVATLPEENVRKYRKLIQPTRWRGANWEEALSLWVTDSVMAAQLWRVAWNTDFGLDCVTFLSEEALGPLTDRLEEEDMPFGHVTYNDPVRLARTLPIHTQRIFTAEEDVVLLFGSAGRLVSDPRVFNPVA